MHWNDSKYLQALLRYLKDEAKKISFDFNEKDWTLFVDDAIPKQDNGYDCGVFVCMFADFLTDNLPFAFSQADMDLFRKKIFVSIKRQKIGYPYYKVIVPTFSPIKRLRTEDCK